MDNGHEHMNLQNPVIVTLTGPSGAGKTFFANLLAQQGFEPLVSTTTRMKRREETNGKDYHFVSQKEFDELDNSGKLIEHVTYGENSYGISAQEAQRAFNMGKPAVLVAEPHGVEQIHEYCTQRGWKVVRAFINNPAEILMSRLMERFMRDIDGLNPSDYTQAATMAQKIEDYAGRLNNVLRFEQEQWVQPAYDGRVSYDLVVDEFNDNAQDIADEVCAIVMDHGEAPERGRKPGP